MSLEILVVDDSALLRRVECDIINSDNKFKVTDTCKDGLEALEKLRTKKYDGVVLDINMRSSPMHSAKDFPPANSRSIRLKRPARLGHRIGSILKLFAIEKPFCRLDAKNSSSSSCSCPRKLSLCKLICNCFIDPSLLQ